VKLRKPVFAWTERRATPVQISRHSFELLLIATSKAKADPSPAKNAGFGMTILGGAAMEMVVRASNYPLKLLAMPKRDRSKI
jgi:hypothetical protein